MAPPVIPPPGSERLFALSLAFFSSVWQGGGRVGRGLMPSEACFKQLGSQVHECPLAGPALRSPLFPGWAEQVAISSEQFCQKRDLISYGSIFAGIALRSILYPRQSGRYLDSSRSSREIPACLKIFMSRSTLMSSPRCELGMTTESSPLAITSCFDPGNGPSNPNFLNLRISSLLETGVSLFDNAYRLRRNNN